VWEWCCGSKLREREQTREKKEIPGEMRLTIFFLDTAGYKISRENESDEGVGTLINAG
jgi:hypothetical protein